MTENSYFLYRPDAPSYGRVSRKFQQIRGGTVGRRPAASIYISTNIILPILQKKLQRSFTISSNKPVTGMLNTCKKQWIANSIEITLL